MRQTRHSKIVFLDKPDPSNEPHPKRFRRWTLPLPPVGSGETLEGVEVLGERPDATGLELFARLRDVLLWMATPDDARKDLFVARGSWDELSSLPREVGEPVSALRRLTHQPLTADEVGNACSRISTWAYERGHLKIATAYAHAAATVRPEEPELAFAVGRSTRDSGRLAYAEAWFQRTAGLARKKRNREMLTAAYFGSGVVHERRSNHIAALRTFEKALRSASVGGLRRMAAAAHQYLVPLTLNDYNTAFGHAAAALDLCPPDDLQLARIAIDAGAMFSEHSHFSLAFDLYEAALPHLTRTSDRLACFANICRASAALGLKRRFAEGWSEMDRIALDAAPLFYAESLVELAHGLVTLRYWKHAARILLDAENESAPPELGIKISHLREVIEGRREGDKDRPPSTEAMEFTATLRKRLSMLL